MAACECGISWERACSMRFTEVTMAVRAHNDMHSGGDDGEKGSGGKVREATQADIKAVFG